MASGPPRPPAPARTPAKARTRTRGQRATSLVLGTLAALLVVLAVLMAALAWLLRSEDGLDWLIARVPGLTVTGLIGRPDGGPMEAARVEWRSGGTRLVIDGLSWRDARWRWRPHPDAWVGLVLDQPRAQRVDFRSTPDPQAAAPQPPQALSLPVQLELRGLEVGALQVNELPPITGLRADARLGADKGRLHEVSRLELQTPQVHASLSATLGAAAPLPLQATGTVRSIEGAAHGWRARYTAGGTLERPTLDAAVEVDGGARVDARATLTPFTGWPIAALDARTQDLDLSTLAAGAPQTRLSGTAIVHSTGMDAPARVELSLDNALPGRWNEARLPVQALRAELSGRPDRIDRIELTRLDIQLGGARPGGRVTGEGRWEGDRLDLALSVQELQPAVLDVRAAPMTLTGPVQVGLRGLPVPGAPAATPWHLFGTLDTTLAGRFAAAPRGAPPVRVSLRADVDAAPDALLVTLERLEAAAGPARAAATATLRRDGTGPWHIDSRGTLARFDPAPWWPAAAALGRGPHALNANWDVAVAWPAAGPAAALDALRTLAGQARVTLQPSRLAGLDLQGEARLQGGGAGATVAADLRAGPNHVHLEGLASRDGRADRWQAQLDAPALQALAPVVALIPGAQAWAPTAGSVSGRASAAGRWPALQTEGELQVRGLRAGGIQGERLDARWSVSGIDADAPLSLSLGAQGLAQGERRIERVDAELSGSLGVHRFELSATTPLRPPAWADRLLAVPAGVPPGTALRVQGDGRWRRGSDGQSWAGTLQRVTVAPRRDGTAPWMSARDLAFAVRLDPHGQLVEAAAEPNRVDLLGATLRWRQARWAATGPARIALDAELEPLRVAPWLARLQPTFGWGGDLALGGRFVVSSGERFDADLVLARATGDLTVTDEGGTRSLGLTDLRLALAAHDGTWHFTQALAGTNVGVLGGAQSIRVAPGVIRPPPDAPLEGVVELRVSDLGVWAPWLPPGWRLGGHLRTSASIGGSVGAPEYTGQVVGDGLAVRNLLQGVDVRDGVLAVTLRGADAQVERFVLRGGDGELRLTGGASFGATPKAQLHISASRFRAIGRVDRRIVVSGDADLGLQAERVTLNGRVTVDEGLIDISRADAPSLDGDVVVVRQDANGARAAASAPTQAPGGPAPLRNATVALQVSLGENLRVRGRGLDTTLAGNLTITAPEGRLAMDGTVRTREGTFEAYGEKLSIERGRLTFSGPLDNPRLDILAIRADLDVRVGVAVTGGVVNPRVRLYSEPDMADMDKLSWLVMGRAPEGLGRADTALLQRAALALVTGPGNGGGGPKDTLLRNIGLDELSVRQRDEAGVSDTIVSLGKQISQRWYIGYEQGLNETAGTWQLIYRVARRFTLRAQAGADNALDVIWTWRWN